MSQGRRYMWMLIDPTYGLCFEDKMNGNPIRFWSKRRPRTYVGFDIERNRFYVGKYDHVEHQMKVGWRKERGYR